jgi:hypothetical protein
MATALPTIQAPTNTGGAGILSNTNAFLDMLMGTSQSQSGGSSVVTSGGVETKQTNVTPEGIAQLIRTMTEGVGGLADVASGAKAAGVYGDTTQVSLVQNLLTKIAGTAAVASAPTVTTTSPRVVATQSNSKTATPPKITVDALLQSALLGGAGLVGTKALKKSGILDTLGLSDAGGSIAGGSNGITGIPTLWESNTAAIGDAAANATFASQAGAISGGATADAIANETGFANAGAGAGAVDLATATDLGAASEAGWATVGGSEAAGIATAAGAGMSAEGLATAEALGAASEAGWATVAGEAAAASEGAGLAEFAVTAAEASSIVCYELVRTGHMDEKYARISSSWAPFIVPATIRGYHYMCPWLLRTMRKHPLAHWALKHGAILRAKELESSHFGGKLIRLIFEPICFFVGVTLARNTPTKIDIARILATGEF